MRRLILWLFPFFVCGILAYSLINYYVISAVISALFLIIFIKGYKYIGLFALIFFFLGILVSALHTCEFKNKYMQLKSLPVYEGYIIDKGPSAYLVKSYKNNYKVVLSCYKALGANPGDYIIFHGIIQDKPLYKEKLMNSKGIDAYIKLKNDEISVVKDKNPLLFTVKVKYRIINALLSIDKEGGAFISGLITGYTEDLTDDVIINFQDLGLTHILAVSGFNLAIVYLFMTMITKKLNARPRYLITLAVCFIYAAIGGFEPSIFRAFLMIFIVILAKLLNRYYDISSGIVLTAFIMLVINSFYIFNLGFLLSFSATFGIILLSKDIEEKIPQSITKLRNEISASLAAFITTLPIILWYKGYFSLISIIVNIIISPIVGIATIISFIGAFLYLIFNVNVILYPSVLIGVVFIKFIKLISNINILATPGAPSNLFIILYFVTLGVFFGYIRLKVFKKREKMIKVSLCLLLIITFIYHDSCLKTHFINVGQGESIFIETPDRRGILIDTGPKLENFSAVKERVLPYIRRLGYSSLDALIFTHFHNDHAGDYEYLLDHFKVGKVIAYKKPLNSKYKFIEVSKGDVIKVGKLTFKILFPDRSSEVSNASDINETCLVMDVTYKDFSMLLTGDAEKEVMDEISGNYNIFNVQHHGSIKSFSTKMVDNSNIGTAVISVGKNNFGHPSKFVINYLERRNVPVLRTDLDGNITVVSDGESCKTLFE